MKGIGNAPDYLGYTTVHALLQVASPCSEHLEGLRHIVSGVSGVTTWGTTGGEGVKGINAKSKINEPTLRGFTPLMYVHSRPVNSPFTFVW